ncbi:hypothetical protein ACRAWF_36850 [Streptomyces sp. L7]
MPSKSSARLAALTVAAVCSVASTIVLTSPAHADGVRIHDIQGTTRVSPYRRPEGRGRTGHRHGRTHVRLVQGFLVPGRDPGRQPGHQ